MKRASGRSELEVKPNKLTTNHARLQRKLPEWYRPGPFLHDARIFMFSFVCLLVIFMLSGELLLSVLVVGSFAIHLLNNVGAKHQAVSGYICVFVVAELTVIYSAIPLLWISLYNVILIFALNAFVVFTGGWVLLHFDEFLQLEPSLAIFIEIALFTFYPGLCVIIMSWVVAQATTVFALPYCIVIFGFIGAQIFLPQHISSFYNSKSRPSSKTVLSPVEVAVFLTIYNLLPMQTFILINFWDILELETFFKLIFVITCPLFLTTLVDIQYVVEHFGFSLKKKTILRWLTGLMSVVIIHIITYLDNLVSSGLYSWLPAALILNLLLGIVINQKTSGRKIIIVLIASACCLLYVAMISYILPMNLEAWGFITKIIWLLLACNSGLTVACIVAAAVSNKDHLSDLLLCSVVVLVFSEHQFLSLGLYSHDMFIITIALHLYTLSKLQSAGKTSWYVTWLSMGIHATKFPVILESQLKFEYTHHMILSPIMDKLFIAMFVLAVSKLFFFESRKSVSFGYAAIYTFSISILSLLVMDSLLEPVFIMIGHEDLTTAASLALVIMTSGAMLLKLTVCHMSKFEDAKTLNLVSILLGLFIFILQPSAETNFSNLSNITLLISFIACLILYITRSAYPRPLCLDLIYSLVIGAPIGIKAYQLLLDSEQIKMFNLAIYVLSSLLTTFIIISTMLWSPSLKSKSASTQLLPGSIMVLSVLLILSYFLEANESNESYKYGSSFGFYGKYSNATTKLFMVIFLCVSGNLKSLVNKICSHDPFGVIYPSSLPFSINLSTILSYILLILNYPPDILPEIWACVCSVIFLLLTKDNFIFDKIGKVKKPGIVFTICVIVLYIATLYQNNIWTGRLTFRSIIELIICITVSPVFFSVSCFVLNRFYVVPIRRNVFLSPICVFLPLFGTSPASWMLGGLGLVAGLGTSYFTAPSSGVIEN